MKYNPQSSDNFYGSWENCKDEFHRTGMIPPDDAFHLVTDSFRIVGNPREEEKFFGADLSNRNIQKTTI
jgi:hypothetical protein